MADDLAIYETLAAAVAAAREPDLSSFDPAEVRLAMRRVLTYEGPRASFGHWLAGRVGDLSNGTMTLEPIGNGDLAEGGDGLLLRAVQAGEPFAEPVSISVSERPVRWPMRSQA